jgi:Questin oxidase-like
VGTTTLDEAYERLHATGPEWGGNLSNHGPMAAEVLSRRGHGDDVPTWVDAYVRRLDELPARREPITDATWPDALGDGTRVGDWTAYLVAQVGERPWRDVLITWWPRLLPGIAAGATHGLIRTGHAVRTLQGGDESEQVIAELGYALGYWAARSTTVPGVRAPSGSLDPGAALDAVPHLAEQEGPIARRLARLGDLAGWSEATAALHGAADPDTARERIIELVDAAALRYLRYGYGSPVLLVHTATAPNAVLHVLPALPRPMWAPSLDAVWAASAAITSTYAPAAARGETTRPPAGADDVVEQAVAHGDEHVIKFADTAVEVYDRSGNPDALAAAAHVRELIR